MSGSLSDRIGAGETNCRWRTCKERQNAGSESSFHRLLRPGVSDTELCQRQDDLQGRRSGDEFFVVVRGRVEIRSGDRHFETLGPDGIFGEMALIDDNPRSATAVALTDATVAPIKENQFLFLVKNTPFFALSVMRVLAPDCAARTKWPDRRSLSRTSLRLDDDRNRFPALGSLDDAHRHRLPFEKLPNVGGGERGAVDEHVPTKIVAGDKSEAAGVVEPFDFASQIERGGRVKSRTPRRSLRWRFWSRPQRPAPPPLPENRRERQHGSSRPKAEFAVQSRAGS